MTPPVAQKSASLPLSYCQPEEGPSRPFPGRVYPLRKADKFLLFILSNLLLLALLFTHATLRSRSALPALQATATTVQYLGLSDLCLSTEAAHTRNPCLVDRHAPFQSHPLALEYFPSGAILPPPK